MQQISVYFYFNIQFQFQLKLGDGGYLCVFRKNFAFGSKRQRQWLLSGTIRVTFNYSRVSINLNTLRLVLHIGSQKFVSMQVQNGNKLDIDFSAWH